ncbi:hypothetical protein CC117_18710 [Parafrankia colletiae]|uniref:VWFA domain-containing protein n=1 Tax=Parafrankia colletiae TaxID=573497 RepID=A0A1S1QS06_9ACTN|nr:VWA domain-containing protein [Parafrankia colletiae]MCK9901026.1 VWA domain-containing protein [Frankia sp. Cpl3]OHV36211.1 hypothetical protein CC117_18710 [Parafrankia colletiae]
MISFTVQADSGGFLARDTTDAHALVTVRAREDGTPGHRNTDYAEVIIVDCSGSMMAPPTKIYAARRAACAAVDALRPGARFAVIRGTSTAQPVYPPGGGLAPATAEHQAEAKRHINRIDAAGGTAIGRWLLAARDLFAAHTGGFRHAILLTDGKNEHETPAAFQAALAACQGRFQCDSRGVGRGWVAAELNAVSDALLGSARDIADPADLAADFQKMTDTAMARLQPEIALRVWVPKNAQVSSFKQVTPAISDLLGRARPVSALECDFPTGAWGAEQRSYHITVSGLRPRTSPDPCRLARISLVSGEQPPFGQADITAVWTPDPALYTQRSRLEEQGHKMIRLERAFTEGIDALRRDDGPTALTYLLPARSLAYDLGDAEKIEMLDRVLRTDPATGEVRIRDGVDPHDLEVFGVRSRFTRPAEPKDAP